MPYRAVLSVYVLGLVQLLHGQTAPAQTEAQKAVEEFRRLTRELGVRADSPARRTAGRNNGSRLRGRIFENFRNDFLDAVPHEIVQRGGTKSILRRNQFGFNVTGPVVIPRVYHGGRRTFFSFSYEGVREHIGRSISFFAGTCSWCR